ncbi:MAG: tetratricopeptide repeat protein [Gemmatimonadota bacterium]
MRRFVAALAPVGTAVLAALLLTSLSAEEAPAQESAAPMIHGAEVRVSGKKWEDAQQFLEEEAIPQYPEEAALHYWLGVVYAQGTNRDTEKAAMAFAKAHELADPEDAELKERIDAAVKAIWAPMVNAAAKAAEAGELEKAQMLLEQATEINPEGPEAWINLGTVYNRQKKTTEAIDAYKKALELQPDNQTLSYNLGILYHQMGRDAVAAGDSAKADEYLDLAESTYKAYLAKNPGEVDIVNNLASLYQERGQTDEMRETLGEVAVADSASQADLYNAGRAFLQGKQWTDAEGAFRKVIAEEDATDPASLEMTSYSMEYLGLTLLQQKKYEEAIEILQKLAQRQPDNAAAQEYLGFAYRDSGRRDEALAAFAKAEELKKKTGGAAAAEAGTSQ